MRNADLGGEARVNRPAARTRAIQFGTRVVGVNNVLRLHAQAFQIGVKERRVRVDIQHARHADTNVLAVLHQRDALFGRLRPGARRDRVRHTLRVRWPEDLT